MIDSLIIENFKSIKKINCNFKKLNIICGENASGKTTIIHSILIMAQINKKGYSLNGNIIQIGDIKEIKNHNEGKNIRIEIICNEKNKILFCKKNEDATINENYVVNVNKKTLQSLQYEKNLFYLVNNGLGVRDTYNLSSNFLFGINGEGAIDFLYNNKESLLPERYMKEFNKCYPNSEISQNKHFFEHVRFWINFIIGEEIFIVPIENTNQYVLTFGHHHIRSINTGSGFSFVLPIVIECLGAILLSEDCPTIILENPENYLHPIAQNKLVRFFDFCKNFEQLIIETHSSNLLNYAAKHIKNELEIIIVKKENNNTQITSLEQCNFKTNPIFYAEILYKAFNIITIDLHIVLFAQLQNKYIEETGKKHVSDFDKYLLKTYANVPQKERHYNGITYKTLIVYIRHCIDHPEQKYDPVTNASIEYNIDELKRSIDFMLSIC